MEVSRRPGKGAACASAPDATGRLADVLALDDTRVRGNAHDLILTGAVQAFGRLGYEAARVEDVLDASGVSRPTFYKHFSAKKTLFWELDRLVVNSFERMTHAAISETSGRSVAEAAGELVDAYLSWRVSLGAFGRVHQAESMRPGTPMGHRRRHAFEAAVAFLVANAGGEVEPLLARGVVAAVEEMGNSLLGFDPPSGDDIAACRRTIIDFLDLVLSSSNTAQIKGDNPC